MDVFSFRNELVGDYERFSRSFTKIRAHDIAEAVENNYRSGRFWPDPLIQLNPNFVSGGTIDGLVAEGKLEPECARIFRLKSPSDPFGKPLLLHRHQREAIDVAQRGDSYVLTTGTGSGKSLSYFIPIINDVLRRKREHEHSRGITAIIVYPMNALCNSQLEELQKFLGLGYALGESPVTFDRYTGDTDAAARERIAARPPDVLLTNYIMLELIMTRFLPQDTAVREHAAGLRFLVLDELHTYRGRQGADVAMLVRRVRERFNPRLRCVGTSATMASEGAAVNRKVAVARIATRLFGTIVKPENVITETLEPVTFASISIEGPALASALTAGVPETPSYDELARHPVAAWIERRLCLDEQNGVLVRARPRTLAEAASMLASDSGHAVDACQRYLESYLLRAYQTRNDRGRNFFAFRLHQFLSGAWNAYATLEPPDQRYITLDGQQFEPQHRDKVLFNLAFCRRCGQEYLPVWADMGAGTPLCFTPRELSDRLGDDDDGERQFGFLMPDVQGMFNPDSLEKQYPEEWLEVANDAVRLKSHYRRYQPTRVQLDAGGNNGEGDLPGWFIAGRFRFCLNQDCDAVYESTSRSDISKLSGLSSEGRSSATTMLTLSALRHLIGTDLDPRAKKLLAFTDNRQDASLQAGHFNDFIQVLLLRGALLAAVRAAGTEGLTDALLTQRVLDNLHLDPHDYAENPEAKGNKAQMTLQTLRDVLGYRLYYDLQRGWRLTNPNLEQLELLDLDYAGLDTACEDQEEWSKTDSLLASADPETRFQLARELLNRMRKALCIKTLYLDQSFLEQLRNRSYAQLKDPWSLSEDEHPLSHAFMVPRSEPRHGQDDARVFYISARSAFGRRLRSQAAWGLNNPNYPKHFDENRYNQVVDDMLKVLTVYGIVERSEVSQHRAAYLIDSSSLIWTSPESAARPNSSNPFFRELYNNVASQLGQGDRLLHQLEAREHTAMVPAEERQEREVRFRKGLEPRQIINGTSEPAGLPVLFCSPTMELGVDIATLNTVYMRNVPPTPANYAQRSGRAGRSGQPALVLTYCAARSPHDQYFFSNAVRMVAGIVNPPTIDLANEDLVRSHLHAVWLAETGVKLGTSVPDVINMESASLELRSDIRVEIERPAVIENASARAHAILNMLADDLTPDTAPWFTSSWPAHVINGAVARFDQTFRRWRGLYAATQRQMRLAHDVIQNAAASERQRREANDRHNEAFTQQSLLLDSRKVTESDFATYRYLASEDFLPGYNFPRLPLLAYIPGRRENVGRDTFLSRPRFLGLSEFGPRSIIYYEGSTYRVRRAILTIPEAGAVSAEAKLSVQTARLCPMCGYAHFGDQARCERCVNCDNSLEGGPLLTNLYRIEQVATRRATRITSDEEERQRQGFDMITTLRFSEENGRLRREALLFSEGGEQIVEARYGPSATLWRINLGWRRRQNPSIFGFSIDVNTGEWTRDSQAPTDAEDDTVRDAVNIQRITPYVADTKNVLVLAPQTGLSDAELVTLQYALKRGIEHEFQLEEAELASEPLPSAKDRRAILFYEAAEGGAGVLTRVALDPTALARIARRALELCHWSSKSGEWTGVDDLIDTYPECEAGCYRCLLGYYNQPYHAEIDRKGPAVLDLLCRLTRAQSDAFSGPASAVFEDLFNASISTLERDWLHEIRTGGYRLPDRANHFLPEYGTCPDFTYDDLQTLVYIDGPHHDGDVRKSLDVEITKRLEDAGFTVIRFRTDRSAWPGLLKEFAWVFSTGKQTDAAGV